MRNFRVLLRFALAAVLFAAPLLAGALSLEWGLRHMANSYAVKRVGMEANAPRLEALVLGPSEAAQGVDPSQLGVPAYNLANVGQDPDYDARLFFAWAGRLPKLRVLIEGISYPSLQIRLSRGPEAWRSFFYRRWLDLPHQDPTLRWSAQDYSVLLLVEPVPAVQAAWRGFAPTGPLPDALGFLANPVTPDEDTDLRINSYTAQKRAATHEGEMSAEFQPYNEEALRAMTREAARRGIRVLWVSLPVSRAYAQAVDPVRRAALRSRTAALALECGADWRDHADDPRFGDSDFFDVDHLNSRGATRFTKLLAAEVPQLAPKSGGE